MNINNRPINLENPPYVIAEMSANHNGDIDNAYKIIDMAKTAGADAVKLQTYKPDTITMDMRSPEFLIEGGLWGGQNLYDLYKSAFMPWEWHQPLFDYAKEIGITIFSSPFDNTAVDLLEDLNAPAYKIASLEVVDLPLIKYVAQTGKPMIISTGMADFDEIHEAIEAAKEGGCRELAVLHCVSGYPAPIADYNLRTLVDIQKKFNVLTGLSDHTMGTIVATTSVALGACVIEKHFTLSRDDKGPDSEFSLEPDELKRLCQDTKIAWESLGVAGYELKRSEKNLQKHRRSIYAIKDIKKGEQFTKENIRSIRPGFGLKPKYYEQVLGKIAKCDIKRGTPTSFDLIL